MIATLAAYSNSHSNRHSNRSIFATKIVAFNSALGQVWRPVVQVEISLRRKPYTSNLEERHPVREIVRIPKCDLLASGSYFPAFLSSILFLYLFEMFSPKLSFQISRFLASLSLSLSLSLYNFRIECSNCC